VSPRNERSSGAEDQDGMSGQKTPLAQRIIFADVGLLFETMGRNEARSIADYSILIDCFNIALSDHMKGQVEIV